MSSVLSIYSWLLPAPKTDDATIGAVWIKHTDEIRNQIRIVSEAVGSLVAGVSAPEEIARAQSEAQAVAHTLGAMSRQEGMIIARRVAQMLLSAVNLNSEELVQLCDLVLRLESEIDRKMPVARQGADAIGAVLILADRARGEELMVAFATHGIDVRLYGSTEEAIAIPDLDQPGSVMVEITGARLASAEEELQHIRSRWPAAKVIAVIGDIDLASQSRLAQLGVMIHPAPLRRRDVESMLDPEQMIRSRVILLTRDDALRQVLEQKLRDSAKMDTFQDPQAFWDSSGQFDPDLLVIGSDPGIDPVSLCQLLRADSSRKHLTVLMVASSDDPSDLARGYDAGADDVVPASTPRQEIARRLDARAARVRAVRQKVEDRVGGSGRRGLTRSIERQLSMAQRDKTPVTVGLLEIDDLRRIAEERGGRASDLAMESLRRHLETGFRDGDIAGLWSGNQFVFALYGAPRKVAVQRANAACAASSKDAGPMSVSGGVAQFPGQGDDVQQLIACAEQALTEAKRVGGGIIVAGEVEDDISVTSNRVDVLVVEDDPVLGELLMHSLQTRGYSAQWINDGSEALERLVGPASNVSPRLLLLDVDLPGVNGIAILRAMRAARLLHRTRTLMLTVRSSDADVVMALEGGAIDYVPKPFSLPVLMQKVQRALSGDG